MRTRQGGKKSIIALGKGCRLRFCLFLWLCVSLLPRKERFIFAVSIRLSLVSRFPLSLDCLHIHPFVLSLFSAFAGDQ